MYNEKMVARVNELVREIKEREAELEAIFGGASPKKTWSRKPKADQPQPEIKPGI